MADQPVAWITRQTKDGKQRLEFGHVASNIEYCKVHHEWEWQPLYLAPQAPPAAAVPEGYALVPVEPTEAMLNAARDWSLKKYGQAVGNDGARGCYAAMLAAANKEGDRNE